MQKKIYDIHHAKIDKNSTENVESEAKVKKHTKLGSEDVANSKDIASSVGEQINNFLDTNKEMDNTIAHVEGDEYRKRRQWIDEDKNLTTEKRLELSYMNDRFKREEKQEEIDQRNSIREKKERYYSYFAA